MKKLAYNERAVLILCGKEYHYIVAGFEQQGCINERSEDYRAANALKYFEECYGVATWTHPQIGWL